MAQNLSFNPHLQAYYGPPQPPPRQTDTPVPDPPLSAAQAHTWILNRYLGQLSAPYIGGLPRRRIFLENMIRYCMDKDLARPAENDSTLSNAEKFKNLLHQNSDEAEFVKFAESMMRRWAFLY